MIDDEGNGIGLVAPVDSGRCGAIGESHSSTTAAPPAARPDAPQGAARVRPRSIATMSELPDRRDSRRPRRRSAPHNTTRAGKDEVITATMAAPTVATTIGRGGPSASYC